MARIAVYVDQTADRATLRNAERGLSGLEIDRVADAADADVIVFDVDGDYLPMLERFREGRPLGVAIGFTRSLDASAWTAAERAGVDRVVPAGRLAITLREVVASEIGGGIDRRIPLCNVADVAGRLGFLVSAGTPFGEVGLFRISGGLRCIALACPHAGASLATGVIESSTVTCPSHGSQFSLDDGSRERGPADCGVMSFAVVEEMGRYFAVMPL